jgi:hypothetical protein
MAAISGCTSDMIDRVVNYTCRDKNDSNVYVSGAVSACSDGYADAIKNKSNEKLNTSVENLICSFEEVPINKENEVFTHTDINITKMSRDCGPSYNLRNIIHHNHFKCRYTGDVLMQNGALITDRQREYKGMLPSCGIGKDSDKILIEDIKEYVYKAVDGESVGLNKSNFDCTIFGAPPH